MKMIANNRITGVKTLTGKGKGTKVAYAGDIFTVDDSEVERLLELGVATEYVRHDPLEGVDDDSEPKAAGKGKKPRAKKSDSKSTGTKSEDGSDTASDEDLGL